MNVLFVTVGTSTLTNSRVGKCPNNRDNSSLRKASENYLADTEKIPSRWDSLSKELIEAHLRYWEQPGPYIRNKDNYLETSAELISTYRLFDYLKEDNPNLLFEKVILLESATKEGQFSAGVVKAAMKSDRYEIPVAKQNIDVKTIPGLDKKFVELFTVVPELVREVTAGGSAYFNVTGGYKGVATVVGMLAKAKFYQVYYQHEREHFPMFLDYRKSTSSNKASVWQ
jgi:putative CRISPR-associated protein (TIGR02619 family)